MPTRVGTAATRQGIEPLIKRKTWKALQTHYKQIRELHLRNLFENDPKRGERTTAAAVGLFLDYSKNRITDETLKATGLANLMHAGIDRWKSVSTPPRGHKELKK